MKIRIKIIHYCGYCNNKLSSKRRFNKTKNGLYFCNNACSGFYVSNLPEVIEKKQKKFYESAKKRFKTGIKFILDKTSCWEWQGTLDKGYGILTIQNKNIGTHRYMWETLHGRIGTSELFVCHKCDNRKCARPSHLWLGTHEENQLDKFSKDRHLFGSKNPPAKLTEKQVIEIRNENSLTTSELAKKYSVCYTTIEGILKRETWTKV